MARPVAPERVAAALRLLSRFVSPVEAERTLALQFKISTRTARRVVAAARAALVADSAADRDARRADIRAAVQQIVHDAMAAKPPHAHVALTGLKMLVELDGLAEATRFAVEHSGFVSDGAVLGTKAIRERLVELQARDEADADEGTGGPSN